jgi:hypothetical protein
MPNEISDFRTTLPGIDPRLQAVCDAGWNAAIEECIAITEKIYPEADDLLDKFRGLRR